MEGNMPSTLSYPGVYIEEIPSGVRTITGVATSVAAFVGRALRGPTDDAVVINSYGDFERIFGGLWVDSTLGFAVRDFYLNGGGQAIIVRLFNADTGDGAAPARTPLTVGNFTVEAAYEGSWGGNLRFALDTAVSDQVALQMGVAKTALFNLTVSEVGANGVPVQVEQFRNLTVIPSARQLNKVLALESRLIRWKGVYPPGTLPDIAGLHTASAALKTAQDALAAALAANPQVPATIDAARAVVKQKTADLALIATDNISRAEQALTDALALDPPDAAAVDAARTALATAKKTSNGLALTEANFTGTGKQEAKQGLYALRKADLFNILCIPPYKADGNVDPSLVAEAASYCEHRRAMMLVDPIASWTDKDAAKAGVGSVGTNSKNAALFFPRLKQPNPLHDNQLEDFVPCGAVAGIFARTDNTRGVWKAPAGLDATLVGVPQLSVPLTDAENGELNPLGVNCLRAMPAAGRVVWGARTMQGDDRLASEWKYIPVRRTALFIEESLYRGTQWVVFEPNDEPLWAQIRLNLGAFMQNLFRQGAFQGKTPQEAYFVKCDKETTTQTDINLGIVNIVVGFAPLKPAEFVVIKLQQIAGQIQT
jgi:phage tail sheath protein FI